jgi:four helix bundle protein
MTEDRRRTVSSFEDLEVFRRAYRVSLDIHKFSLELPAIEQRALADQLRRASKSICANLAEGYARGQSSAVEFKRFMMLAMGSAEEMRVWLRYALDLGYLDDAGWQVWRDEYQAIARMLQALRKAWR